MDAALPPDAAMGVDPWAIDGKFAAPEEHARLLVIGGGPAGLAAAIQAAALGLDVVLVDENPVPLGLMGLDVPLFYGQRMNAAVQQEARMVERLVTATPAIAAAFDAGVDVRLGVAAWGAFANGPAMQALPTRMVGLSDGKRSWLCGFDALILATGARDLVLGFQGIDLPGVMGACALHSLLTRYDAFDGKTVVVLGSGDLAVTTALCALDRGVTVASLVEVADAPQAAPSLLEALAARGVPIRTATTVLRAEGDASGVAGIVLSTSGGAPDRLACDTVCLAIGVVPVVELADLLGCRLGFRGDLGGHVPTIDEHGATSLPGVFCAGDCAGVSTGTDAQTGGRDAAQAAFAWLQDRIRPRAEAAANVAQAGTQPSAGPDTTEYRLAWMRALLDSGDGTVSVCLCEDVSRAEFSGIQPPRYLGCTSPRMAARNTETLLADGPLNPDQIKRLTRAGMGPCQGRRCREQIALLLALASGTSPAAIRLAGYRAPVRPTPLAVLADAAETPQMQALWDVWFGIRTQWVPYDIVGTAEEAAFLAAGAGGNMHA